MSLYLDLKAADVLLLDGGRIRISLQRKRGQLCRFLVETEEVQADLASYLEARGIQIMTNYGRDRRREPLLDEAYWKAEEQRLSAVRVSEGTGARAVSKGREAEP